MKHGHYFVSLSGETNRGTEGTGSGNEIVDASVKRYMDRGFTNLMICFGCTGGQHRSVYSAQHMAEHIHSKFGVRVDLVHREQNIEQLFNSIL